MGVSEIRASFRSLRAGCGWDTSERPRPALVRRDGTCLAPLTSGSARGLLCHPAEREDDPMPDTPPLDQLPPRDRLTPRPAPAPLPTRLDPAGPESHGFPADPKPAPNRGQGDPKETTPAPDDIGRSA